MQIISHSKLHLPAYFILGVVLILLVFLSVSTYHNFHRQRRNAQEIVLRQGLALLKALAAGTRSGTGANQWDEDALDQYILKLGQIQDIAYLYILDARGVVIHSTGTRPLHGKGPHSGGSGPDADVQTRLIQDRNGTEIYEIARENVLLREESGSQTQAGRQPTGVTVVLGMRMSAFDEARRADLHHAFIMTVIVLALGAGAIYFIYVIQNYHQMNRTLRQTQEYARQVVASLATGLLSIDLEGRVVSCNQPALKLLDIAPDKIEGIDLHSHLEFEATGITDTLSNCRPNLDREVLYQSGDQAVRPLSI